MPNVSITSAADGTKTAGIHPSHWGWMVQAKKKEEGVTRGEQIVIYVSNTPVHDINLYAFHCIRFQHLRAVAV